MHSGLAIQNEFLRQQVQRFAVLGKRNATGLFDRLANIFAADLAGARAERDSTMAVDAANMRSGHSDHRVLHRGLGYVLGFLDRFLDAS